VNTTEDTITIKRLPGGDEEVINVKIGLDNQKTLSLNEWINELETKTIKANYDIKHGTTIEVAAVIGNSRGETFTCPITDSTVIK